ncbi:hypothetical protein Tco_0200203 [Tanacetum coccineum]
MHDETLNKHIDQVGSILLDPKGVKSSEKVMAGEEFVFHQQVVPGVMFGIGTRNEAIGSHMIYARWPYLAPITHGDIKDRCGLLIVITEVSASEVLDTFFSWWNDVAGLLSAKQALHEFVILLVKFSQFFVGLLFSILITGVLTNAIKDATG